ncbi:LOW QUALITY PROTEIN: hypothetical protein V2J09_000815 [Rumex salicifolius]
MSGREWPLEGLNGNLALSRNPCIPCDVLFSVTLWWLWRWRNDRVFGGRHQRSDVVRFLLKQVREFEGGTDRRGVAWTKPGLEWVKVNTDGAKENSLGIATAGGVIRDDAGRWICGFVKILVSVRWWRRSCGVSSMAGSGRVQRSGVGVSLGGNYWIDSPADLLQAPVGWCCHAEPFL